MLAWALLLSCAACGPNPAEPTTPAGPRVIPVLTPLLVQDSACTRVTFTFVGSKNIEVTFPNRATCSSGVALIPGGTPTRNGSGSRNANIPIRLLNRSGYTLQGPARVVLSPVDRVILDPAGGDPNKLTPQNHDSVRAESGAWVWLAGGPGTVAVDDSSAVTTLVVRLASPAGSAQMSFTVDVAQLAPGGWPLLTDLPSLDTTKTVTLPGGNIEYFRTSAGLIFKSGVSDQAKQQFFGQHGLSVIGVTKSGKFFVSFPDPGTTAESLLSFFDFLEAKPDVLLVMHLSRSGMDESISAPFPSDSAQTPLTVDVAQPAPGGWHLLTGLPLLDPTKTVTAPGGAIEYFRTSAGLLFKNGVSDQEKQQFLNQHGLRVIGVTQSGKFFVSFPDPGTTVDSLFSFLDFLAAQPEVSIVMHLSRSGTIPSISARILGDSAQMSFTVDAGQLAPGGWPLLTWLPKLDPTMTVTLPGTETEYFRTSAVLGFKGGVSDQAKQGLFNRLGLTVIGVTQSGNFFVSFPDPGPSMSDLEAYLDLLESEPEVAFASQISRTEEESISARHEGGPSTRAEWPVLKDLPLIDTSKTVHRPGTDVVYARTTGTLIFRAGISDQEKRALFARLGMTVLGVTASGRFFVSFPDPGPSLEALESFESLVRAQVEVESFSPYFLSGITEVINARSP